MTPGRRLHYAEMLRRARDEYTLVLAALASVERGGRSLGSAIVDEERRQLIGIASALQVARVVPEAYGHCEHCGLEIETARLDIAPWTRWCGLHDAATNNVRVPDSRVA